VKRTFVRQGVRLVGTLVGLWGFGILMTPVWNTMLSPTGVRWSDPADTLQSGLPPFLIGVTLWVWATLDARAAVRREKH